MKLIDILPKHPVEFIQKRTFYPASLEEELSPEEKEYGMMMGYCKWDGIQLISLDGDNYSSNETIVKYVWDNENSLIYWIESEWI